MYNYTCVNGEIIKIEDVQIPDDLSKINHKLFKVNLPSNEDCFKSGNGEGVWAITTDENHKKFANNINSKNEKFLVRLLNEPIYYDSLHWGDYVLVESRGSLRPTAIYSELVEKYGESRW